MTKFIFDKDYGEYVFNTLRLCEKENMDQNSNEHILNAAKYCTLFFMSVVLRAQDRVRLPPFLKLLKSIMKKSSTLCEWLLQSFCDPKIIKEYLISCSIQDMKYFIVGILKIALKKHY